MRRITGGVTNPVRKLLRLEPAWVRLHEAACESGDIDYIDPETGFRVLTEVLHLGRGTCCGNACRHCPYGHFLVNPPLLRSVWPTRPVFLHHCRVLARQRKRALSSDAGAATEVPVRACLWGVGCERSLQALLRACDADAEGGEWLVPPTPVLVAYFDSATGFVLPLAGEASDTSVALDVVMNQARALSADLVLVPSCSSQQAELGSSRGVDKATTLLLSVTSELCEEWGAVIVDVVEPVTAAVVAWTPRSDRAREMASAIYDLELTQNNSN